MLFMENDLLKHKDYVLNKKSLIREKNNPE